MIPAVSFAVQAHPARAEMAAALAEKIGGEVVLDPDPDGRRSPWRTFRHLLETTPTDATHRFQIQDDAAVCRGLRLAVERAVEARPDRLLLFYVGENPYHHARAIIDACRRDEPWAELSYGHWCPVVATCWPVGLIAQLLEFVDEQRWPPGFTSDDEIVGRFVRHVKHRPLASVPSLVEHPDEEPSLIKTTPTRRYRRATCWIGDCDDCTDAATIDWTAGPGG